MQFDLENMSRADLEALRSNVDKAIKTVDSRELKKAREAAEAAAAEHGFTLAELTGKTRKSSGSVKAKYRNPSDAAQTWSGRGRKPQWVKDVEAAGSNLSEFAI